MTTTTKAPAGEQSPEVIEFLTDPKHQKERDFMTAIVDDVLAKRTAAAQEKTDTDGGSFVENFFDGLTGGLFRGEGK